VTIGQARDQASDYAARLVINDELIPAGPYRDAIAGMYLIGYETALEQFDGDDGISSVAWRDGILAAFADRILAALPSISR
jgi:hypothetical protein